MSPSKPGDPSKGKPAADEQAELEAAEAKEATAQEEVAEEAEEAPEPKPRRSRAKKTEEEPETAAGTPEAQTAAKAEEAPKPRRSRSRQPEPAPASKPRREAPVAGPVVRAQARYVRTSARKARLVCDLLRGKSVQEARAILAYSQRSVARDWAKVLESAIANAEHNHELVGDDLRILTASADEGPTLKRFRPRAMGRATRIRKRTSHLTITLTPKE
jgi:large subunit ribosomal protein L22